MKLYGELSQFISAMFWTLFCSVSLDDIYIYFKMRCWDQEYLVPVAYPETAQMEL